MNWFTFQINGVKIDANEPEWIVNLKKSIAGQLQLDLSGVRQDGPTVDISAPKDGQGASLTVFEVKSCLFKNYTTVQNLILYMTYF